MQHQYISKHSIYTVIYIHSYLYSANTSQNVPYAQLFIQHQHISKRSIYSYLYSNNTSQNIKYAQYLYSANSPQNIQYIQLFYISPIHIKTFNIHSYLHSANTSQNVPYTQLFLQRQHLSKRSIYTVIYIVPTHNKTLNIHSYLYSASKSQKEGMDVGKYIEHIVMGFMMEALMATACNLVFMFTKLVTPSDTLFSVTLPILLQKEYFLKNDMFTSFKYVSYLFIYHWVLYTARMC